MSGSRQRLSGAAHAGFLAGYFWGLREYWLMEARKPGKVSGLREARLAFARSAHSAYLKELARALHLQRHEERAALAMAREEAA